MTTYLCRTLCYAALRRHPQFIYRPLHTTVSSAPSSESPPRQQPQSTEKPNDDGDHTWNQSASSTDIREQLCETVLTKVNHHGWTTLAIDAAIKDMNLSPASSSLLPSGIATVSDYLDSKCNTLLAQHTHETKLTETTAPERASYAMCYRLSLLDPYHQFWYQAVALRPKLAANAVRNRLLLADEVSAFAHYNSPNFTWYSDRLVMVSIYQAAELYWLADTSPQRRNTKQFILTRLNIAHDIRTTVSSTFSNAMSLYDATISTASTVFRASRNSY